MPPPFALIIPPASTRRQQYRWLFLPQAFLFSLRLCYNRRVPLERENSDLVRVHAVVRGLVQGVNFRWYTQRRAAELGLCGFVRNLPDGWLEVVAEGERSSLATLLDWVRVGPSAAIVESVDAKWSSPTGEFSRFEVRY